MVLIVLKDPCPTAALSTRPSSIFSQPLIYSLRSPTLRFAYNVSDLVKTSTFVECSFYPVKLTNSDGSQIDRDLFEDDREWAPDFVFKVLSTDNTEAVATYNFDLSISIGDGIGQT